MNYKIRKILEGGVSLLQDFLYEAKKVVGAVWVRIMDILTTILRPLPFLYI